MNFDVASEVAELWHRGCPAVADWGPGSRGEPLS
jgi:hypothetical protein